MKFKVLPEKNTRPNMFIELTYSPLIFQVYKFSGSCPSAFISGYVSTVRYCWVQAYNKKTYIKIQFLTQKIGSF